MNNPIVMGDCYCDLECPFLEQDDDNGISTGRCKRDNVDLLFHDWYLAQCMEKDNGQT